MSQGSRRHRILIVTRNLPPLVGGMERLNWHMAEELAKVAEVRIVGPVGSAGMAPAGVPVREAPLKPLWKFLLRARALARREAREWKPDLVLAGSGLTAPLARSAARLCGARTAVYVHGLDVAVRHPAYRAIWLPALRRMNCVIANSRATADLCRGIGVDTARIGIVHPGVELPADLPPSAGGGSPRSGGGGTSRAFPHHERVKAGGTNTIAASTDDPRTRYDLGAGPLLLSVGRLSARKGLREFVEQALPRIVAARPDVMLLIVGGAPSQALHAQAQTQESIQAAADAAGIGTRVRFLGKVADDELARLYLAADVHVFPVREIPGDPEGFGMVAVEAAAHGLPTVAFACGGVEDAVAEDVSGHLVKPNDYHALADAIVVTFAQREALRPRCLAFACQFAWPVFGREVLEQLQLVEIGGLR